MMFMRLIIAMLMLVLLFGCIEQRSAGGSTLEKVINIQSQDLEGDGNSSYMVYDFAPVQMTGTELTAQRELLVSVNKQYTYQSINENITDSNFNSLQKAFQDFDNAHSAAELECSKTLGLEGVVCIDTPTCSKLCAGSTSACKDLANNYQEALGNSIISYIRTDNDIKTVSTDLNVLIQTIQTSNQSDQYLAKTQVIINDIAALNANPIYNGNKFALCSPTDFGVQSLLTGARVLGNFSMTNVTYHYTEIINLKSAKTTSTSSQEILSLNLVDKLPKSIINSPNKISSKSEIITTQDAGNVYVNWSQKPSQNYMLIYEFDSNNDPQTISNGMTSPSLQISTINASFVGSLLLFMNNITKNYYLALGLSIGLIIVVLMFIYAIINLLFNVIGETMKGGKATAGIRKAVSGANSKWQGNGAIAVAFIVIGYVLAIFWIGQPENIPAINEIPTFILSGTGAVPVMLELAGIIMLYMTIESAVKVTVSQKMYGSVIRGEKESVANKAGILKNKIIELKKLVEKDRQENFDVSREYDIASSVSLNKIEELSKNPNQHSNIMIDQEYARVENAITSLSERKKTADEKWSEWKTALAKMLDERNEVFADSLLSIPSSLRLWALERYAKEGGEALIVERNVLKRKTLTPDKILEEMIEQNLIKGAVVLKNEKLFIAKFAQGSGTVISALTLKLRTYAQSLAKNMGEGNTSGFAAIGEKTVTLYIKGKNTESILFINKDKYREAVERWKLKTAVFEE